MSYTQAEVELLKECLKEICDEHFFSTLHELRKKLVASSAKQQDLEAKLKRYEEDIQKLQACHSCHPLIKHFSDASTQTKPLDSIKNAAQEPLVNGTNWSTSNSNSNHANNDSLTRPEIVKPKIEIQPKPSTSCTPTEGPELICIESDEDM